MTLYPNLFTWDEIHSPENLRGFPGGEINNRVHLSAIRIMWDKFYGQMDAASRTPSGQGVLDDATFADDELSHWMVPRKR